MDTEKAAQAYESQDVRLNLIWLRIAMDWNIIVFNGMLGINVAPSYLISLACCHFMNRDVMKSFDRLVELPVTFIQRRLQHAGWCIRQSQAQQPRC